jgi:dihydropteroate synthase
MGVLNATPDSFFDKGAHFSLEKGIERALEMARFADILDVGGESTRPGAERVSEEEERRRVLPLIEAVAARVAIPLSIDTYKVRVARAALEKGAKMLNDITGFADPAMQELAASCEGDLCLMHMQKTPTTMQNSPGYPEGVVEHIMHFFEERIESLVSRGVREERIILDPGIGFGKRLEHNIELFNAIGRFKGRFGLRVLIGASRKACVQQMLGKTAADTLAGTLAVHSYCLFNGADILRAHDVQEHRDLIDVFCSVSPLYATLA